MIVNIVRYPPPLHTYQWEQLDKDERKIAFKKLQEIDRNRVTEWGQVEIDPDDWPEEWDSWNVLQPREREEIYKKLQVDFLTPQTTKYC